MKLIIEIQDKDIKLLEETNQDVIYLLRSAICLVGNCLRVDIACKEEGNNNI